MLENIGLLVKLSNGGINIDSIDDMDSFEFMFYLKQFSDRYKQDEENRINEKNEMFEFIAESITALFKAIR